MPSSAHPKFLIMCFITLRLIRGNIFTSNFKCVYIYIVLYSIYYISIEIDGWRCYLYTHWATGPYIWSVGWSSPAGWGTGRFRSDTSVGGNGGAAWAATLQLADRWSGTASLRLGFRAEGGGSERSFWELVEAELIKALFVQVMIQLW